MSGRRRGRPDKAARISPRERAPVKNETRVEINSNQDIVTARQRGRLLAQQLGFSNSNLTLIATAISELARNILLYARHGELTLGIDDDGGEKGLVMVARDHG